MTVAAEKYPHLLSYRGVVVPWVTRWTDEQPNTPLKVSMTPDGLLLHYEDGKENRESNGILWIREGIMRGGEPQFSQVSTYRQRACMVRCRCQVCGKPITDEVIPWLFAPGQLQENDGKTLTMNPPTCSDCVPIARELCPHLKRVDVIQAQVLEYRAWGVSAELMTNDGRRHNHQMISYDKEYPNLSKTAVVAKQQVVELTKFTLS